MSREIPTTLLPPPPTRMHHNHKYFSFFFWLNLVFDQIIIHNHFCQKNKIKLSTVTIFKLNLKINKELINEIYENTNIEWNQNCSKKHHHLLLLSCSGSVTTTLLRVEQQWTPLLSPIAELLLIQFLSLTLLVFNLLLLPIQWYNFCIFLKFFFCSFMMYFYLFFTCFQKFKRLGLVKNRLIARCTSGSDEFGSLNGIQLTPNKLFVQEVTLLLIFFILNFVEVFKFMLFMLKSVFLLVHVFDVVSSISGYWCWIWGRIWNF